MKYLLDTNVFREVGKSRPHENVQAWLSGVDDAELAISALTVREVAKGIARLALSKPAVAEAIRMRTGAVFDAFAGRILAVDRAVVRPARTPHAPARSRKAGRFSEYTKVDVVQGIREKTLNESVEFGIVLAEGMRFELTVGLDTLQRFSKQPPSATRPPLRREGSSPGPPKAGRTRTRRLPAPSTRRPARGQTP